MRIGSVQLKGNDLVQKFISELHRLVLLPNLHEESSSPHQVGFHHEIGIPVLRHGVSQVVHIVDCKLTAMNCSRLISTVITTPRRVDKSIECINTLPIFSFYQISLVKLFCQILFEANSLTVCVF